MFIFLKQTYIICLVCIKLYQAVLLIPLNHIRKHKNFGIIRPRIDSYPFIHEIFLKKDVELCIVEKDIDPNTMYLNLIIYKNKGHEIIVLGLKKNNKNSIYIILQHYIKPMKINIKMLVKQKLEILYG